MWAGLAGSLGFSATGGLGSSPDLAHLVPVRVFWLMELSGLAVHETGEREAEEEAEEMEVSSPPLVSVPVIVISDSERKFESYDFAPCRVEVVQSEQPEVFEKDEILLSSSSTLLAGLVSLECQEGARGLTGDSKLASRDEAIDTLS